MRKLPAGFLLLAALALSPSRASDAPVTHPESAQACFSPKGGCTEAVVREITAVAAKTELTRTEGGLRRDDNKEA